MSFSSTYFFFKKSYLLVSWTLVNSKLYTISHVGKDGMQGKTFTEAQALCAGMGEGVTLYEPRDQETITAIFGKIQTSVWLNVEQVGNSGEFRYISDGTTIPTNSDFWKEDEPNDVNERCANIIPEGLWNDIPCESKMNVLCQKEIGTFSKLYSNN